MESTDDDDDLKLVKASAGLLANLESAVPKTFWKSNKAGSGQRSVHKQVKRRDLEYLLKLIEPFQLEPQLLDARLKHTLTPIVDGYTQYLQVQSTPQSNEHVEFQKAVCLVLYTLCKVRGYKVVSGFLRNEPRYLDPILAQLEDVLAAEDGNEPGWQVPFLLLLWLSHLLLTPFDLTSISDRPVSKSDVHGIEFHHELPPVVIRTLRIGLHYLPSPTKAQDAAAILLVRLVARPDMQKLRIADSLVSKALQLTKSDTSSNPVSVYKTLGPMNFLARVSASPELEHLIPTIYETCEKLSIDDKSAVGSNAVAKKIMVKIFRNMAVLSLRSASTQGPLLRLLEAGLLEAVIEYLLLSLGDRDTPVRFAAAKAIGLIVLELDSSMGHEIIQAVLDAFREDMPQQGDIFDFRTSNAVKWHGLTLALAHTLFKRSAALDQLPDIVNALISALQFEQRSSTGSSVGTNVRDAANFGIWSLSRRYHTKELLAVDVSTISMISSLGQVHSVIQGLAIQLVLSACLDPAGNIRRGSSAALQELIGRHPNEVPQGIALVQIVDYLAVGLRNRAMVDIAYGAAELHPLYRECLIGAILEWRGLGSSDVSSRESAAASLAKLSHSCSGSGATVLAQVMQRLRRSSSNDSEGLHGLVLSLACLLEEVLRLAAVNSQVNGVVDRLQTTDIEGVLDTLKACTEEFSPRLLRSELPAATARLLSALCQSRLASMLDAGSECEVSIESIDMLTQRLLIRNEESILQAIPPLVQHLAALKSRADLPLGCLGAQSLSKNIAIGRSKSTLHGAGRAIALGALAPRYANGLHGEEAAAAVATLGALMDAMNVEWRIIGIKALQLAVETTMERYGTEQSIADTITNAVHRGLNDYTIDERGDVGSLVRLESIYCTSCIFNGDMLRSRSDLLRILQADIVRLSLEKLDRVRLAAAQCRHRYLGFEMATDNIASVSSYQYFSESLKPLTVNEPAWIHAALLEGSISCAGISAEPLLQASRAALMSQLNTMNSEQIKSLMERLASHLKSLLLSTNNTHSALELLAFLLDMQIPQRLAGSDFKWISLLSTVQKSHHKSNDILKILAAVHVYIGLADIWAILNEVLKKLVGMLKTNPYPRVRVSVAEALFVLTNERALKSRDWTKPVSQHLEVIEQLQKQYLSNVN